MYMYNEGIMNFSWTMMDQAYSVILVCLLIASSILPSSTELIFNNFQLNKVNGTTYGEALSTSEEWSALKCFSKCSEDEHCKSATFDETHKSCKTNRETVDPSFVCDAGRGCSDPSYMMYTEKHLKTTMRLACKSNGDCMDPNSLCVLGQCQCEPGYSYNGTSYACVTSCAKYGTTFQPDLSKRLVMNNVIHVSDVSLEECKVHCVTESSIVCKSFEYLPSVDTCNMHTITALDDPSIYKPHNDVDLYTRACAT